MERQLFRMVVRLLDRNERERDGLKLPMPIGTYKRPMMAEFVIP